MLQRCRFGSPVSRSAVRGKSVRSALPLPARGSWRAPGRVSRVRELAPQSQHDACSKRNQGADGEHEDQIGGAVRQTWDHFHHHKQTEQDLRPTLPLPLPAATQPRNRHPPAHESHCAHRKQEDASNWPRWRTTGSRGYCRPRPAESPGSADRQIPAPRQRPAGWRSVLAHRHRGIVSGARTCGRSREAGPTRRPWLGNVVPEPPGRSPRAAGSGLIAASPGRDVPSKPIAAHGGLSEWDQPDIGVEGAQVGGVGGDDLLVAAAGTDDDVGVGDV